MGDGPGRPNERMGSTDLGNVSYTVPAIHPYIAIVPETVPGHSREHISGREDLAQGAMAARNTLSALQVNLPDIAVELGRLGNDRCFAIRQRFHQYNAARV